MVLRREKDRNQGLNSEADGGTIGNCVKAQSLTERKAKKMQVFVFVLNRTEHLEHLLQTFSDRGFTGATVLDSKGMARILHSEDEMPIFYGLRAILEPERRSSKTIFMVLPDERVEEARKIVNEVTGGLEHPDSGIMFAIPLTMVEGLVKKK